MSKLSKLKPCPFCNEADLQLIQDPVDKLIGNTTVLCKSCGATASLNRWSFLEDELEQRISDLERQLKAEREINDRLRVVETERAVRNDELYEALDKAVDALYSSYDATEWPANGTSHQELAGFDGKIVLDKYREEYGGASSVKYVAVHTRNRIVSALYNSKVEASEFYPHPWEIIPIRVSGDYDDSH